MQKFTRRDFLKVSATSACTLVISTSLQGCGSSSNDKKVAFKHGVASGDPLQDSVIIWSRVTPKDLSTNEDIDVSFEVAMDKDFKNIIRSGTLKTNKQQDFSIKVDVKELEKNTYYYYRFASGGVTSITGKTKTLATGDIDQVKMAVFTCSNYPNGYFNAYTEASKIEDLDVSLHLGDYIYEYGMYKNDNLIKKEPAYATKMAKEIKRELPEDNMMECIELDDYRKRYALYHTDEGLQKIHAACPMIVVWDDHEIANDTYKNGAENHNAQKEGLFSLRSQRALQAYFEWLPIRPSANPKEIFRSFNFGNLVSLHMLETRLFARDEQLSYSNYYKPQFDLESFMKDFTSVDRHMIGDTQLGWLQNQLKNSQAQWQVLGQQVLMGKMNVPVEILEQVAILQNEDAPLEQKTNAKIAVNKAIGELVGLKMRLLKNDPTLTNEEKTRLQTTLPYNLDAWDGYFAEREKIFALMRMMDKNLVVLAGDSHNSWANDLKDKDGNQVGVEFAVTSVTSPGMEDYVGFTSMEDVYGFEQAMQILIDDLKYFNANDRGFMVVTFTPQEATSTWYYVDNNKSTNYTLLQQREKSLKTLPNKNNRKLV